MAKITRRRATKLPKCRTWKQIEAHPFVSSLHKEWDGCFTDKYGNEVEGIWCSLHTGFIFPDMECGSAHERTLREIGELLENARRVTYEEIKVGYVTTNDPEEAERNWAKYDPQGLGVRND